MEKEEYRAYLLRTRSAYPAGEKTAHDRAIAKRLSETLPGTGDVFFYVGEGFEVATREAMAYRLSRGGGVCVPLCGRHGLMTARRIESLAELAPGRFGLPEPGRNAPEVRDPCAVIVPGLAFDASGARLGRGGGYYDRWLQAHPGVRSIGLCYEAFLMPLPEDAYDRRVGEILTERRRLVCS